MRHQCWREVFFLIILAFVFFVFGLIVVLFFVFGLIVVLFFVFGLIIVLFFVFGLIVVLFFVFVIVLFVPPVTVIIIVLFVPSITIIIVPAEKVSKNRKDRFKIKIGIKICKIRTFSCNHHHSVGRICGCWNRCRSSCAAYPCRHSDHKV